MSHRYGARLMQKRIDSYHAHQRELMRPPKPAEPPIVLRREDGGTASPLWWLLACVVAAIFLTFCVSAAKSAEVTKYRVIDADTIEAELRLEFGYLTRPEIFRLHDFDAWESRRIRKTLNLTPEQWDAEVIKGKAAKAALEQLLSEAKVIELREVKALKADPRGRELADLYADGVNVADVLRKGGHERK